MNSQKQGVILEIPLIKGTYISIIITLKYFLF